MIEKIRIVEVGPRDGFQSSTCSYIPTETKLSVIGSLVDAGIRHLEFSSFVSPKAVPQLADAETVTRTVLEKYQKIDLFALIPNLRGAQTAYRLGLRKVCYVVSLSESHNQVNVKRSHQQSMEEYLQIREAFPDLSVELELATAFGCPFEGKLPDADRLLDFLNAYIAEGIHTVCLCDTIGVADPAQVSGVLRAVRSTFPSLELELHFHDSRGLAMANAVTAINEGVSAFQTALGGLGGCPHTPGAAGNLATEDLVFALEQMGYNTGLDFQKLLFAAKAQKERIPGLYSGHNIQIE